MSNVELLTLKKGWIKYILSVPPNTGNELIFKLTQF